MTQDWQSIVAARPTEVFTGSTPGDWQTLREKIALRRTHDAVDHGFPCGMAAGSVNYDGSFCFGFYDDLLVYRHVDRIPCLMTGPPTSDMAIPKLSVIHSPVGSGVNPVFTSKTSREDYCAMVLRAKEYIAAGDIYQVNLSHRFSAPWSGNQNGDALQLYASLRHYSPAPYAAYLDLGGRAILSSSPELFLYWMVVEIRTCPIKGNLPSLYADPTADELSAYDLITSPKEIAELVMITDLERNDPRPRLRLLHRAVLEVELLKLERYEQVFHLVSTVEGQLRAEIDHVAAARCLPGGSITGAPKNAPGRNHR